MPATSRRGRRPADHGDTELSIRRAALRRFADSGFDATRLRDIAADAGVDVALISYRFGSKLGLWKAVVERLGANMLHQLAASAASKTAPPGEALAACMKALIDINCDNESIPRFFLRDAGGDPERSQWAFDHMSRPVLGHFLPFVRRAHDAGDVSAPIPELFFLTFAYGAAVSAARRDRIVAFVPALADEDAFRQSLYTSLIAPHVRTIRHG